MKFIAYLVTKMNPDCPIVLSYYLFTCRIFFSQPSNKHSKAESEQAVPTELKAEEPPAATIAAAGMDLGLETQAEEPVEEAVVSTTSCPLFLSSLPLTVTVIS